MIIYSFKFCFQLSIMSEGFFDFACLWSDEDSLQRESHRVKYQRVSEVLVDASKSKHFRIMCLDLYLEGLQKEYKNRYIHPDVAETEFNQYCWPRGLEDALKVLTSRERNDVDQYIWYRLKEYHQNLYNRTPISEMPWLKIITRAPK